MTGSCDRLHAISRKTVRQCVHSTSNPEEEKMSDQDCSTSYIPVLDFSCLSLEHKDPPSPSDEEFQSLAKQIYDAFSTVGFAYLKNHGLLSEQVGRIIKANMA